VSATKSKKVRTPPSKKAIKLATAIAVEVFGRHHVDEYHVNKIAAVIDAERGKRTP
jgi:hypothetical protein